MLIVMVANEDGVRTLLTHPIDDKAELLKTACSIIEKRNTCLVIVATFF